MKKFFTLMFAFLSVTSMFAQIASSYEGTTEVKVYSKYGERVSIDQTVQNQIINFKVNDSETLADMTLPNISITAAGVTVTMSQTTVTDCTVTKSEDEYSISKADFKLVLDNGTGKATVTGNITASKITKDNATLTITITDLPTVMTYLYSKMTADYTLKKSTTTGLSNVAAANNATNCKCMKNGKLTIMKDGKEYNAAGQLLK